MSPDREDSRYWEAPAAALEKALPPPRERAYSVGTLKGGDPKV